MVLKAEAYSISGNIYRNSSMDTNEVIQKAVKNVLGDLEESEGESIQ